MPLYKRRLQDDMRKIKDRGAMLTRVWKPFFEDYIGGCTCTVTDNEMLIKFSFTSIQMKMVCLYSYLYSGVYYHACRLYGRGSDQYDWIQIGWDNRDYSGKRDGNAFEPARDNPDGGDLHTYMDVGVSDWPYRENPSSGYPGWEMTRDMQLYVSPDGTTFGLAKGYTYDYTGAGRHVFMLVKSNTGHWSLVSPQDDRVICEGYENALRYNLRYHALKASTQIFSMAQAPDPVIPGVYSSVNLLVSAPSFQSVASENVIEIGDEQYYVNMGWVESGGNADNSRTGTRLLIRIK